MIGVKWTRNSGTVSWCGSYVHRCKLTRKTSNFDLVVNADDDGMFFRLDVMLDGNIVHRSEHASTGRAMRASEIAILRAIDLRDPQFAYGRRLM